LINIFVFFLVLVLTGCSGPAKNIHLVNTEFGRQDMMIKESNFEITRTSPSARPEVTDNITMPGGTLLGGASSKQAAALASIVEQSHNITMWRLADLKKEMNTNKDDIKESIGVVHKDVKGIISAVDSSIGRLTKEHQAIESRISKVEQDIRGVKQGMSSVTSIINETRSKPKEITLFYNQGSSTINKEEKQRLIGFINSLDSGSFHVTCRATASPEGSKTYNLKLGQKRCDSIQKILSHYFSGLFSFESKAEIAEKTKREDYEWARNVKLTLIPAELNETNIEHAPKQVKHLSPAESKKQPEELKPLY